MNRSLDAPFHCGQGNTAEAAVLATWYASHAVVRRLWAIEEIDAIRIIVKLEPTSDGGDTLPAWLANNWAWAQELRSRMHRTVHLEMIGASPIESVFDRDRTLITEISWREEFCS